MWIHSYTTFTYSHSHLIGSGSICRLWLCRCRCMLCSFAWTRSKQTACAVLILCVKLEPFTLTHKHTGAHTHTHRCRCRAAPTLAELHKNCTFALMSNLLHSANATLMKCCLAALHVNAAQLTEPHPLLLTSLPLHLLAKYHLMST